MDRRTLLTALAAAAIPVRAIGTGVPPVAPSLLPPPYRPRRQVSGTIRVWGHGAYGKRLDFVEGLMNAWEDGFRAVQPGIRFENALKGTASAIGALYTGAGDVALMGREIWDPEIAAFKEVRGYAPTGIDVMTGSFDVRNRGYAITFFVNDANPVRALSLDQLDAIFSLERRRGHAPIRTWGDVGLTGAWKEAPITLYGLPIARGFAEYLQDRIFLGSEFWNPSIREFADQPNSVSKSTDGAPRMLAAIAADPHAIGYAGLVYDHPGTHALALSEHDGGKAIPPTIDSVRDHSYPLIRLITMYLDRAPGKPVDPKVDEFVRFILSRDGQQLVERKGEGYLPMLAPFARRQISKLEN
jgi:phosphate transport system substrate-binding protein